MACFQPGSLVGKLTASCIRAEFVPRWQLPAPRSVGFFCYDNAVNMMVSFASMSCDFGRTFLSWTVGPRMVATLMNSCGWHYETY